MDTGFRVFQEPECLVCMQNVSVHKKYNTQCTRSREVSDVAALKGSYTLLSAK